MKKALLFRLAVLVARVATAVPVRAARAVPAATTVATTSKNYTQLEIISAEAHRPGACFRFVRFVRTPPKKENNKYNKYNGIRALIAPC